MTPFPSLSKHRLASKAAHFFWFVPSSHSLCPASRGQFEVAGYQPSSVAQSGGYMKPLEIEILPLSWITHLCWVPRRLSVTGGFHPRSHPRILPLGVLSPISQVTVISQPWEATSFSNLLNRFLHGPARDTLWLSLRIATSLLLPASDSPIL